MVANINNLNLNATIWLHNLIFLLKSAFVYQLIYIGMVIN